MINEKFREGVAAFGSFLSASLRIFSSILGTTKIPPNHVFRPSGYFFVPLQPSKFP
jgi:hypothetical protein